MAVEIIAEVAPVAGAFLAGALTRMIRGKTLPDNGNGNVNGNGNGHKVCDFHVPLVRELAEIKSDVKYLVKERQQEQSNVVLNEILQTVKTLKQKVR
jgi:hypothetical protein